MTARPVFVIGAGVVGLSAAIVLAERGREVRVIAEQVTDTDSEVAAALWAVPFVEQSERVRSWAYDTLARLRRDATADAGVREQLCRVIGLTPSAGDPWTRGFTPAVRAARADELPDGFADGTISSIPLVDTSRYLGWLRDRAESSGVAIEPRRIEAVDAVGEPGDVILIAAGFGARALVDDSGIRPVRSQIVRVANPGLEMTTIVREGPLAPLFIVPRHDDVVIGGPAEMDVCDPVPSLAAEDELLRRAALVEPALASAAVRARAVGHRPFRERIRLDAEWRSGRTIVHCYGHGGAGVALSWGTAAAAADLVEEWA